MSQKNFEALDRLKATYFSGSEQEKIRDILAVPTFMVSDGLKKLLVMHGKETKFKGVQVFPKTEGGGQSPMYWIPCSQRVQ